MWPAPYINSENFVSPSHPLTTFPPQPSPSHTQNPYLGPVSLWQLPVICWNWTHFLGFKFYILCVPRSPRLFFMLFSNFVVVILQYFLTFCKNRWHFIYDINLNLFGGCLNHKKIIRGRINLINSILWDQNFTFMSQKTFTCKYKNIVGLTQFDNADFSFKI